MAKSHTYKESMTRNEVNDSILPSTRLHHNKSGGVNIKNLKNCKPHPMKAALDESSLLEDYSLSTSRNHIAGDPKNHSNLNIGANDYNEEYDSLNNPYHH